MDAGQAVNLAREALKLAMIVGTPVLAAALAVGLVVSLMQAATQVQDHTLSFVPKLIAVAAALAIFGHWMLERLVEFSRTMFAPGP